MADPMKKLDKQFTQSVGHHTARTPKRLKDVVWHEGLFFIPFHNVSEQKGYLHPNISRTFCIVQLIFY